MLRVLTVLITGLGIGGGVGFLLAAANGITLDGHDHDAHGLVEMSEGGHAHHDILNLASDLAPELTMELLRDTVSGWNLHVETQNFRFAPEHSGQADVLGEGHAHVYVNGEKIARLYGNWMHISSLPEKARIEVTLNSNDHKTLGVDGVPISAVSLIHGTD